MEKIKEAIQLLSTINYSGLLFVAVLLVFAGLLWRLNNSEKSKFFFDELLTSESGHASSSKIAMIVALIVSTWAFFHVTLQDKLTEWFFALYMGIWVLNRGYSKYLESKENK